MKLICISGKAQNGKDTLASYMLGAFEDHGKSVLIFHYADLLKFICEKYFKWDGQKDEKGREMLQRVGTDVIRKKRPDYWVDFATNLFWMFKEEWDYVLIPDTRFPNEIERLRECGFDVTHIRIERPDFDNGLTDEQKNHPSETALDGCEPDVWITNDRTLKDLKTMAENEAIFMMNYDKYSEMYSVDTGDTDA